MVAQEDSSISLVYHKKNLSEASERDAQYHKVAGTGEESYIYGLLSD